MTVSNTLKDVGTIVNTVVNMISNNPVLSAFIGISLVTLGAIAFKKLIAR